MPHTVASSDPALRAPSSCAVHAAWCYNVLSVIGRVVGECKTIPLGKAGQVYSRSED